jgi:hypothetical protein
MLHAQFGVPGSSWACLTENLKFELCPFCR